MHTIISPSITNDPPRDDEITEELAERMMQGSNINSELNPIRLFLYS